MSDKKYSPHEAALMVLAKAQELYKSSNLAKGEWNKIHSKLEREGYSKESADKIDGAIKAKVEGKKLKKDEGMVSDMPMGMSEKNPDEKADAKLGEKVEREVEAHEEGNEDPKHEMKGHIKLAKFMGAMEAKRGKRPGMKEMDKAETGHEKGIHTAVDPYPHNRIKKLAGMSEAGTLATGLFDQKPAKEAHKKVLGEMKEMPKPKLPG